LDGSECEKSLPLSASSENAYHQCQFWLHIGNPGGGTQRRDQLAAIAVSDVRRQRPSAIASYARLQGRIKDLSLTSPDERLKKCALKFLVVLSISLP
jgi:hypothetical protein